MIKRCDCRKCGRKVVTANELPGQEKSKAKGLWLVDEKLEFTIKIETIDVWGYINHKWTVSEDLENFIREYLKGEKNAG